MLKDIGYALRTLRRSPGFTAASVLVLALAIGANTAMFCVLNAVLLKPLPYPSPDQLAMLWTSRPQQNVHEGRSAYWNVGMWRRLNHSFTGLAVLDGVSETLAGADGAEQINVARVSPEFFPLLGVMPDRGRIFSAGDATERRRLAVISYRFWQSRFGGSPDAIGAPLELDGQTSRVIGILPEGFHFARLDADVWEPETLFPDWSARQRVRGTDSWFVLGRLRPGVTIRQAQAEMTAIEARLDDQLPAPDRNLGVNVVPLSLQITGPGARLALWLLAGAVFCVLLVAAINIAGLSLARGASREREIAIRAALGAGRVRIVRQLLAESVTLAAVSGLLGLLVAEAGIRLVVALQPGNLARLNEVSLDPRALGWASLICLLTGILVGLAPAVAMMRSDLRSPVQEGGRGVAGRVAARGIRRALVVAEMALAIVLLTGAGLLIRSLWSVENVDPGFRADRVLSMELTSPAFADGAQMSAFYDRVLERIQSLPGVESAGIVGQFFIGGNPQQVLTAEPAGSAPLRVRRDEVSRGFFKAMDTPLLRGRFFSPADGPGAARVAIVNQTLAGRLWPGRDPIGQRVSVGRDADRTSFTVVGVVGDMRREGLESEPVPQFFEPLEQSPSRHETLLVRTSMADPLQMAGTLRAAVHQLEKQAVVYRFTTLDEGLGAMLAQRRFQTTLLFAFALVALLMAAIGIYGLIQYTVKMRTHEIGIRVAVGAQAGQIFRMILREGLLVSLTGTALGLAGALLVSRTASSLLFGVAASDPVTFVAVSLLLLAIAMTACWIPAHKAMSVDPIVALRDE